MSFLKSTRKLIASFDSYGHAITLNFNRKGDTHKTCLGGFLTIGVWIFLLIYFIVGAYTLFDQGGVNTSAEETTVDLRDIG